MVVIFCVFLVGMVYQSLQRFLSLVNFPIVCCKLCYHQHQTRSYLTNFCSLPHKETNERSEMKFFYIPPKKKNYARKG